MRIAFLLKPDVKRMIEQSARQSGRSFEQVLNDAIRTGPAPLSKQRVFSLARSKVDLRNACAPAEELEDEYTIARRHAVRDEPSAHS